MFSWSLILDSSKFFLILSNVSSLKIGYDFSGSKIDTQKNVPKKWSPKLIFSDDFSFLIPSIFDIKNWLWKYIQFWHFIKKWQNCKSIFDVKKQLKFSKNNHLKNINLEDHFFLDSIFEPFYFLKISLGACWFLLFRTHHPWNSTTELILIDIHRE